MAGAQMMMCGFCNPPINSSSVNNLKYNKNAQIIHLQIICAY
jgi:hypothetical protein